MPTHAGPNTRGEENLVFSYDLGDVQNSYKGEPAFNRATALGNWSAARSSLTLTTEVEPPVKGAPVYILERTATNAGVLVRDANSGFGYTNNSDLGTVGDGTWKYSIWVKGHPATNTNTAFNIDVGDRNGQGLTVNPSTGWTKLETDDSAGLNNGTYKFFDFNIDGALNNKVYVSAVMITTGNQSHPQWLSEKTTRSVSGSLIDLTGNSTLDLTNVSFDSNAQMTFDGSNDYIAASIPTGSAFTIETLINQDSTPVDDYQSFVWASSGNGYDRIGIDSDRALRWRVRDSAGSYSDKISSTSYVTFNQNCHIMIVLEGGTIRYYKNGTLTDTFTGLTFYSDFGGSIRIGHNYTSNQYFNGDIPMIKIYNRALTASEIKANYNAIKGRFNI